MDQVGAPARERKKWAPRHPGVLLLLLCVTGGRIASVQAFSARESRPPWEASKGPAPAKKSERGRFYKAKQLASRARVLARPSTTRLTAASDENNKDNASNSNDGSSNGSNAGDGEFSPLSPSRLFLDSATERFVKQTEKEELAKYVVNGAAYEPAPTVFSSLGPLFQLTRPSNFPGVILLHLLGGYLSLSATGQGHLFAKTLLQQPSMWIVLTALLLTSSTSMVVNDYYDKKLGRDTDKTTSPLVSGELNLSVVRTFLNYLYAIALVCVALVPGVPARMSVVGGLMLTFWYTKHLKPMTWIKNVMCASLIALSPFTSGTAALKVASEIGTGPWGNLRVLAIPGLWRLVMMLFWGVCGREIYMDMTDLEDDKLNSVRTIPVKYGKKYASGVAMVCYLLAGLSVLGGPLAQIFWSEAASVAALKSILLASSGGLARRLAFASVGSLMLVRRGIQVFTSKGEDNGSIERTVDEAQIAMIICLGSFI